MMFAYTTSKTSQNTVVEAFAKGAGAKILPIDDFLKNGLPKNSSCVIFAGLLFGNARVLNECLHQKINYYYIDHAYFRSGYAPPTWMRITYNGFVQNNIVSTDSSRWNALFNTALKSYNYRNRDHILILPPSDATARTFSQQDWLKNTIREIRLYTDRPIIVRQKSGPVMNQNMTKVEKRKNYNYNETLEEHLRKTYCVVAYNSNAAIQALMQGIPVICSEQCAAYPLSNKFENIENLIEYKRLPLLHSLSWGQYNLQEIVNGTAYKNIKNLKQVFQK